MSYIDPVNHSTYPTPVVEPVEEDPADEAEREEAVEEWDDDRGHNVDTSA